jgi:hypothetical protein
LRARIVLCYSPVGVLAVWFVVLMLGVDGDAVRPWFVGALAIAFAFYIHGTRAKLRATRRGERVDY